MDKSFGTRGLPLDSAAFRQALLTPLNGWLAPAPPPPAPARLAPWHARAADPAGPSRRVAVMRRPALFSPRLVANAAAGGGAWQREESAHGFLHNR